MDRWVLADEVSRIAGGGGGGSGCRNMEECKGSKVALRLGKGVEGVSTVMEEGRMCYVLDKKAWQRRKNLGESVDGFWFPFPPSPYEQLDKAHALLVLSHFPYPIYLLIMAYFTRLFSLSFLSCCLCVTALTLNSNQIKL